MRLSTYAKHGPLDAPRSATHLSRFTQHITACRWGSGLRGDHPHLRAGRRPGRVRHLPPRRHERPRGPRRVVAAALAAHPLRPRGRLDWRGPRRSTPACDARAAVVHDGGRDRGALPRRPGERAARAGALPRRGLPAVAPGRVHTARVSERAPRPVTGRERDDPRDRSHCDRCRQRARRPAGAARPLYTRSELHVCVDDIARCSRVASAERRPPLGDSALAWSEWLQAVASLLPCVAQSWQQ